MTTYKSLISDANLFTFNQTSDIQDVVLGCAGLKRLVLGFQLVDTGSYVSGAQLLLLGSFDRDSQVGQFPITVKSLIGSVGGGGNVVYCSSIGFSQVVVENLPPWLTLSFSATTFGTSPGQSSFIGAASWR